MNKCSIFLTKPLAFLFFSCIIDSETRTDVLIIEHPRIDQERMLKMERTYVLNFIFKVLAACGVIAVFGVAGLSDGGVLSTAEVFIYGIMSFLTASFGVWGAYNCTKAIEAEKLRRKRACSHAPRLCIQNRRIKISGGFPPDAFQLKYNADKPGAAVVDYAADGFLKF